MNRSEIAPEYKWDLSLTFSDDNAFEQELKEFYVRYVNPLNELKGHIGDSAKTLAAGIQLNDDLNRAINKISMYTSIRYNADTRDSLSSVLKDKTTQFVSEVEAQTSWIFPDIMKIPDEQLQEFLKAPEMHLFIREIEILRRKRDHILSEAEEAIISRISDSLSLARQTYSKLFNSDLATLGKLSIADGSSVDLTASNYLTFLRSEDRDLRKRAFKLHYNRLRELENTFAVLLNGKIKASIFYSSVRKYTSPIEQALFPDNIDIKVYDTLIKAIHEHLPSCHQYFSFRKKVLKIDQLNMWDMYVPLLNNDTVNENELNPSSTISYETAKSWILEAMKPLGENYVEMLKTAFSSRWIDLYPSLGKSCGAFSSGTYDTPPYILMNFTERIDSVFTLAHELGHSMHKLLTRKQPHIYSHYKIFIAEIASTTCEALLFHYLLDKFKDNIPMKRLILNTKCDDYKTTVFRQTMFAEFEKTILEKAQKDNSVTLEFLKQTYYQLNSQYYGPELSETDKDIELEWIKVRHFFNYNFYVFKYATSFCASEFIASELIKPSSQFVSKYIDFLSTGNREDPLVSLRKLGLEMDSDDANYIHAAMKNFDLYLSELQKITK